MVWQHRQVVPAPSPPPSSGAPERSSLAPPSDERPAHFSLFGIPVRVGIEFWVLTLIFGFRGDKSLAAGLRGALTWTAVVFVSIMIHELGHALVVRRFGARPVISLHALGGLTSYTSPGLSRPRQIAVSLAGPFAGFALGAVVWFASRKLQLGPGAKDLVTSLLFVNIGWGIINMLPVLPLDGGHVLAATLGPRHAFVTWAISGTVGGLVALLGLKLHLPILVVLFGFATFHAIGQARVAGAVAADARAGLEDRLREAKEALGRGDLDDAWLLADDVVRRAKSQPVRNGGLTALAWVHVERGQGARARAALAEIEPAHAIDPYTVAAVEDAAGASSRAKEILEEARRQGYRTVESSKLLIDLCAREGRLEAAVDVAVEDADLLSRDDVRAVIDAALDAGATRSAARLAARAFEVHGHADDALAEARALALSDDVAGALAALAHAVALGGLDRDAVRADPAFAALSADERFSKILG